MKPLLLILSVSLPLIASDLRHDSGIHGPKWEVLAQAMTVMQSQNPDLLEVRDYGRTPQGRIMRLMVMKGPKTFSGTRQAVILTGAIHGNEYLHLEDRIPNALIEAARVKGPVSQFIARGGVFIFVPIINPDGYDLRKRGNAKGENLNRDWPIPSAGNEGFTQPETVSLNAEIQRLVRELDLKIELNFDYHCCGGGILYPRGYTSQPLPEADFQRHLKFARLVEKHLDIKMGTVQQILGYKPLGATLDYYYETYGAVSLTYEGRKRVEEGNFEKHLALWLDMIQSLPSR